MLVHVNVEQPLLVLLDKSATLVIVKLFQLVLLPVMMEKFVCLVLVNVEEIQLALIAKFVPMVLA
jgi:hypothetical protein